MSKKTGDIRGKNGASNLAKHRNKEILKRKKILKKVLEEFEESNVPLVIADVSERSGISLSTLNRAPYKEMIDKYREEEKSRLSPTGKREISMLLKENQELKKALVDEKEKSRRILKEVTFIKEILLR